MVWLPVIYLSFAYRVSYSWKLRVYRERGERRGEERGEKGREGRGGKGKKLGGWIRIYHKNRHSSQSPCTAHYPHRFENATRGGRASKKHFYFFIFFFSTRRKFLTTINHDYLTEASPTGQYILLTKSHVGSRAQFFAWLPGYYIFKWFLRFE